LAFDAKRWDRRWQYGCWAKAWWCRFYIGMGLGMLAPTELPEALGWRTYPAMALLGLIVGWMVARQVC